MSSSDEEVSFQVNLDATPNIPEDQMRLTFFGLKEPLLLDDSHKFIPLLNTTIQNCEQGSNISIIKEIKPNSENYDISKYNGLSIFLFSKLEEEKRGILIGSRKDQGVFIIGVWPFKFYQNIAKEGENLIEIITDVVNSSDNYTDLLLCSFK